MRLLKVFVAVFITFFLALTLAAAPKLVILPVAAKKKNERQFAYAVDKELSYLSADIKEVRAVSYRRAIKSKAYQAQLKKCLDNLKCQKSIARKGSRADFYLFSKLKIGKGRRAFTVIYLFDRAFNRLDSRKIRGSQNSDEVAVAEEIIFQTKALLADHLDSEDGFDEEPVQRAPQRKYDLGPDNEELITTGLQAYRDGKYNNALKSVKKAAKGDVVAKKLVKLMGSAISFFKQANKFAKNGKYDSALGYIARFEKTDEAIRKIGVNYRVFSRTEVEHSIYLSPTKKDVIIVRKIYKQFAKKIELERKKKVDTTSAAEKWLNDSIIARIKEIEALVTAGKTQKKNEKKEYGILQKKIKDLKYQWEKDDSVLEQKLVKLESRLTMMQQQEKGVIKVSTKKIEDAQKAEHLKNNTDLKKKKIALQKEKKDFYDKQTASLNTISKGVDVKVTSFGKKQTTNKDSIKKLKEKLAKQRDVFDAKERKIAGTNEGKKMSAEDVDRKYRVTVEKDYQIKFDALNKKLQEYDAKEALEKKKLGGFNKEKENYLIKNADEMGSIQEDIAKKREVIDAKYKKDKADAKGSAEKEYTDKVSKAKTAAEALAKELADKKEKSEAFIAGEEEALKAAGKKPAQIKATIKKLKKTDAKEIKALEKKSKKATKELTTIEGGKDDFIQQAIATIDMTYEKESMELDMKLANENARLQKDNKKFSKGKNVEKKQADKKFKQFLANKARFKKNIDHQISLAQKDRDRKLEKRKQQRTKDAKKWETEKKQRQSAFDRKTSVDNKKIERLRKQNETIEVSVANANQKLSNKQEDLKIKQHDASEKFETAWQEKMKKLTESHRSAKEGVEGKYAQKEVNKKQLFKKQKEDLDNEIEAMNGEKARRKEKRKNVLLAEKTTWIAKQKEWKTQTSDRKLKIQNLKKAKRVEDKADRKEASSRKRSAEKQYKKTTTAINDKMLSRVQKKYPRTTHIVVKREVEPSALSSKAILLKATVEAKTGLKQLQNKKLIDAMNSFKASIYLDSNNKTALNGIAAVESTAKTLFWEAYGIRDSNKPKAVSLFKKLIKTLTPANEIFIRSLTELESLR